MNQPSPEQVPDDAVAADDHHGEAADEQAPEVAAAPDEAAPDDAAAPNAETADASHGPVPDGSPLSASDPIGRAMSKP